MQLHPLQQLVHVERGVVVVEPDDEPERDEVRLERIHEAAAERIGWAAASPACGSPRSSGCLVSQISFTPSAKICGFGEPTLLPLAATPAPAVPRVPSASTVTLRGEVGRRRDSRQRLPVAVQPGRRRCARPPRGRPSTSSAAAGNPVNRLTPSASALLAQPAHDLAERGDVVAVVAASWAAWEAGLTAGR